MDKQIETKINELLELCKAQSTANEKDSKLPRAACIILVAEFTDEGKHTKVDVVVAMGGGHSDLHELAEHGQAQSPELKHFMAVERKHPIQEFLEALRETKG